MIINVPAIDGLTFRGFRGEEDYPVMAAIINAANLADGENNVVKAEEIAVNYAHLQRSNTATDMVFIEVDGQPVGYGRCMWDQDAEGDYLYSFFLHMVPKWRGKGIGRPVIAHFLSRLAEISAEHPADAPKYYQSWAGNHQVWYLGLLKSSGMVPVRWGFEMVRPCSQPVQITALPAGLEVQPVDERHYRAIWEADVEAFRDHWGFVEPTEEDYLAWIEQPEIDPSLWKVAFDGDEVVGMVRNYINKDENLNRGIQRGYTENISVRRPWRRQGVARALLTESIQMFIDMGMDETALGVDTENPSGALDLYLNVGYMEIKRGATYRKPITGDQK
jgi:ribosomal protein S18 acetylase RimI-like enzyme